MRYGITAIFAACMVCGAVANAQPPEIPVIALPSEAVGAEAAGAPEKRVADKVGSDKSDVLKKLQGMDRKELEDLIVEVLKRREAEKAKKDEEKKKTDEAKKKADEELKKAEERANDHGVQFREPTHCPEAHLSDPDYDKYLKDLVYDSLSRSSSGKKWYEKLSLRGYTQIRFGRTLETEEGTPNLFGDRTINGNRENFLIRRARLILQGDVTDHLFVYIQPDFASNTDGANNNTFYAQLRDLYADWHIDKDKVNRIRIGLSKVPYGFENLQSSQNRVPLDRTDAMNTAVAPNERDLGLIYYWTPVATQKVFKALVDGGIKGSGNYGLFGVGVYDGQGGSQVERNLDLHWVAHLTYPWEYSCGKFMEASIHAYRGNYVVSGSAIRPLGKGDAITPAGTGGNRGLLDQRVAVSYVIFPQPFGFQAEWEYGEGPGLASDQTRVSVRNLHGGYVMGMYRHETDQTGIVTPYVRWQQYTGGYRNIANSPFGQQRQLDLGVEWQLRKEFEITLEYSLVNTPNFSANANGASYKDFEGSTLRLQMQFNY